MTFLGPDGHHWALARWHEVAPGQRDRIVPAAVAATMVAAWSHHPEAWPLLLELFGDLSGSDLRAPSARDVESALVPRLCEAIQRGDLVALREPMSKFTLKVPPQRPPPPAPKPARKVIDKHFLDVTIVDDGGTPLVGRRYRLQLPSGIKEEGRLDASARIFKPNVDEGTARFWILPEEDKAIEAADVAPDSVPTRHTLRLRWLDLTGHPVSNEALTVADSQLTTDGDGFVDVEVDEQPQSVSLKIAGLDDSLDITLGALADPGDQGDSGWRARLYNLGFLWDPTAADDDDETVVALEDFQAQYQLPVTGKLDDATLAQIGQVHGC